MKILYLINSSEFFCSHFLHLAQSVYESGHSVTIACGDDIKRTDIESIGLNFSLIDLNRKSQNPFNEFKCILSIFNVIQNEKSDIIHMLTIKPVIYAGLILRLPFVHQPNVTIFSVTGLGSLSLSTSFIGKSLWYFIESVYKLVLSKSRSKVIFENTDDLNLFVSNCLTLKENTFLINGAGVNTNDFIPSIEKRKIFTVVLVARLLKDKGIREFIEAGKILKEKNVTVSLMLVGSVDDKNISSMSLQDIEDAHTNGYIEYEGFRSDINEIYRSAHVACLPSYREGLPKSLIEAASCGLPILTTDVPGCRQMVFDDQKNGLLVPPYDAHALADAIMYLRDHSDEVKSMGYFSRKIAIERFDYKIIQKAFFSIYGI